MKYFNDDEGEGNEILLKEGRKGKFDPRLRNGSKTKHIGVFDSPEEAAIAHDKAAIKLRGEFAVLNYPEKNKK